MGWVEPEGVYSPQMRVGVVRSNRADHSNPLRRRLGSVRGGVGDGREAELAGAGAGGRSCRRGGRAEELGGVGAGGAVRRARGQGGGGAMAMGADLELGGAMGADLDLGGHGGRARAGRPWRARSI